MSTFPCARCGAPLTRTHETPRTIRCRRCRFRIYDSPRLCAGLVVVREDSVLLLKRGHRPKRGFVDIPGGFMEARETFEGAARRELLEETGLRLGRVDPLGTYWDTYFLSGFGRFATFNAYFIGRWRSGEPRAADDAASAAWVPIAALGRPNARYAWKHMREVFRDVRRWMKR